MKVTADDYAAHVCRCYRWSPPWNRATRRIWGTAVMVAATPGALAPYAGWLYTLVADGLRGWFLSRRTACIPGHRKGRVAPMSLFHRFDYDTDLLFAAVAVCALLPVGAVAARLFGHSISGRRCVPSSAKTAAKRAHKNDRGMKTPGRL